MTRTTGIVALAVLVAAAIAARFALHLVYGWRPAPRVDRDVWPEGVGTW